MANSNKTHITISLPRDVRDAYKWKAQTLGIPFRTLLRLVLIENLPSVPATTKGAKKAAGNAYAEQLSLFGQEGF